MSNSGIVINTLGGNCPVQADGEIDGVPFYFRARGERWSIEIGLGNTSAILDSMKVGKEARAVVEALGAWEYGETWPGGQYAAGWMTEDEARACVEIGARAWRARWLSDVERIADDPTRSVPGQEADR